MESREAKDWDEQQRNDGHNDQRDQNSRFSQFVTFVKHMNEAENKNGSHMDRK